tara:strand:- start:55540 stop:56472 length:933 start_codon:yes stop_codon:yes gene_type:complete
MQSKIYPIANFPNWKAACDAAHKWLRESGKETTLLFEQNRNLGDTLHLTPIIRHYRLENPDAAIVFLVGRPYSGAHEFNPDIDKIFCVPVLKPKDRVALRKHIISFKDVTKVIAPSIFPYADIWKELSWSYADIASQYFANAEIEGIEPKGGRNLIVKITDADRKWAKGFMKRHNLKRKTSCVLEYNSYSAQPVWRAPKFTKFVQHAKKHGIKCISIAGKKEKAIPGTIDATGISWRQSVALFNEVGSFIGVGSGLTMLAASADNSPNILEIAVDDPVNMNGCGYATSIKILNPDPVNVADHLWFKVLNG